LKTNLCYIPQNLSFVNTGLELHMIMVGPCGEIFILVTQMPVMLSTCSRT